MSAATRRPQDDVADILRHLAAEGRYGPLLDALRLPIRLSLSGESGGVWTLFPSREHGIRILRDASCVSSTTIHMSASDFLSRTCSPNDVAPMATRFTGDQHLAQRVFRAITAPSPRPERGTA